MVRVLEYKVDKAGYALWSGCHTPEMFLFVGLYTSGAALWNLAALPRRKKEMVTMLRKTASTLCLAIACLALSSQVQAEMMWAKMNWDVGLVKFCPDEGFPDTRNLTYQDAHVEIQVAAFIEDKDPPPQTANGGFPPPTPPPQVTWDDQGNNFLTVNWKVADSNKPVVGASHIGVGFQVDTLGKNSMDCAPKILHASLTGVTCESLGMTTPQDTAMPVITPGWTPHNSALVRFAHENTSVTGRSVSTTSTSTSVLPSRRCRT